MIYFNDEQKEKLKPIERFLMTAYYHQYKMPTTRNENQLLMDVFQEATGNKPSINWSCATCVFNFYKECGEMYYGK